MLRLCLLTAIIWPSGNLLTGNEDTPPKTKTSSAADTPSNSAKELDALRNEFSEQMRLLAKRMEAIKDTTERAKRHKQEYTELQTSVGDRLMKMVRKAPKDPVSLEALQFVMGLSFYQQAQKEAIQVLIENHAETKGVGRSFLNLDFRDKEASLKFARIVAERNLHRDDRAQAFFAIGSRLKKDFSSADLTEPNKAKVFEEAKKAFEVILEKYADANYYLQPIAPLAKAELAGLLNIDRLVVGAQAPEIVGKDLDGKALKLSDYRGKVVLVDFWAHW